MFFGLDNTYKIKKPFGKIINMQWRRRYYEYGNFEMYIPKEEYDSAVAYIWNTDTNEVAIVNKVYYNKVEQGSFVTLSGYFYESMLSRAVAPPIVEGVSEVIEDLARALVNRNFITDVSYFQLPIYLGTKKGNTARTTGMNVDETEVGLQNFSLLKAIEESQRLRFDYDEHKFYYDIWQGADHSIEGPGHIIFSEALGNIKDIEYTQDDSDYKNFATIEIDTGDEYPKLYTFKDISNNKPQRRIYYTTNITDKDEEDALLQAQQEALLELLNHQINTNIHFTPIGDYYEYGVDYTIGDKVSVVLNSLGLQFTYRIVGVDEVYKNGMRELSLYVGDMKKMLYQKGRY